jgi:hypothetical protein
MLIAILRSRFDGRGGTPGRRSQNLSESADVDAFEVEEDSGMEVENVDYKAMRMDEKVAKMDEV